MRDLLCDVINNAWPANVNVNVDVNVNLYSALSHSASNALSAPNTAVRSASSIGDRSWRCWVLDHAGRCWVRSRRLDQPRRTHDGLTCRAVFLTRRVGGGWPNEGAVVRRLGRPAYTAQTGSPGHDCEDTYATSYRAWTYALHTVKWCHRYLWHQLIYKLWILFLNHLSDRVVILKMLWFSFFSLSRIQSRF